MSHLYIIRGLPGSGKSTLARQLCKVVVEADNYFMVDGVYKFNPSYLETAHQYCRREVMTQLYYGDCAVANTFTRRWEYRWYIDYCDATRHTYSVIDCHGPWKSIHDVPQHAIDKMKERWEPYAHHKR